MLRTAVVCSTLLLLAAFELTVAASGAAGVVETKCREFMLKNTRKTFGAPLTLNPQVHVYEATNCTGSIDLIVNGEAARRGEFPHQALLGYVPENTNSSNVEYDFRCGGSLISERFVLSAAHCGTPKIVRLAEHDLLEDEDEEDFDVARFIKHPDYKPPASYHDIALVQLIDTVIFSFLLRPACLWTTRPLNQTTVIATGFGHTEFLGNSSTVLMKVRLAVRQRSSCEEKFEFSRAFTQGIKDEQLCVGSQKGGQDTCHGDSGGPIQVVMDPKACMYHVVGVTSIGTPCGTGDTKNIYTQVASYLDWIVDIVWPGERIVEEHDSDEVRTRIHFPNNK